MVEQIKYIPPRERLEDIIRIDIVAPSAATNKGAQRQQIMLMIQISESVLAEIERLATEVYQTEGLLALIPDIKRQVLTFRVDMFLLLIELHDVGRLKPKFPKMRDPLPWEQQMSVYMQQIQDLQMQVQELEGMVPEEGMENEQGF